MASPASAVRLSDLISVRSRFGRSTHLERDFAHFDDGTSYHLTPSVYEVLGAVAAAWEAPVERAMTLIGPYGAGKSALGVFLAHLVENPNSAAARLLQTHDPALAGRFSVPARALLPVLVVGSRTPISLALVRALTQTLQERDANAWTQLQARHSAILESAAPAPRAVADLFADAAQFVGAAGVLLVVDELGKFLEYAAGHPKDGDIFVLQELAEAAARSGRSPLFVIGVLHQSAEAYAHKLGRAQQAEWAKVAERFRQVTLFPSDVERMDMVGYALEHSPQLALNGQIASLAGQCRAFAPVGLHARFAAMASAAYPLHPLTLLALPPLFRRAGQSHRSVFNFLAGEDSYALNRFLRENQFNRQAPPLFSLDALFDYAAQSLLAGWSGTGNLARTWAEAVDAVERAQHLAPELSLLAVRALKGIGLLGWLREAKLAPSPEVLVLALDEKAATVEVTLQELQSRGLIVWSRARHSFRLWEGGDVDIEAEMNTARAALPADMTIRAATDPKLCPLPRLIARRHSFQTGTLRTVHVVPCRADALAATASDCADELTVVLALASNSEEVEDAIRVAETMDEPYLLIGIAQESELLREAALDVAAAGHVAANVPQLEDDRAARRELELRREEAETLFRREWERLFGALSGSVNRDDDDSAQWLRAGQTLHFNSARSFSAALSDMADATYYAAPILKNELINRRALSGAGAGARRLLIAAMLENPDKAQLALSGFPPELSMYQCLLRATGLHREHDGSWQFAAPAADDPAQLGAAWQKMEELIFTAELRDLPVPELYAQLQAPPYGLSEGVLPVLLCAFMQVYEREIMLYKEGTFLPEARLPDWEVLLRREKLFSIFGCRLSGARARAIERLAQSMQEEAALVPIVRNLLRRIKTYPEHAWKTRRLPPQVLRLRDTFERARSPEKLLFLELPAALDLPPLDDDNLFNAQNSDDAVEEFFGRLNEALALWNRALPDALETARDNLLQACALPVGEAGWQQLQQRALGLQGTTAHALLVPFLNRLNSGESTLANVLAVVANRPPHSWSDADVDGFAIHARAVGTAWQEAVNANQPPASTCSTALQVLAAPLMLAAPEQKAANDLVKKLNKHLTNKDGTPFSSRVKRAALLAMLEKLPVD